MTPAGQRYETLLSPDFKIISHGDCLAACVATVLDCDIGECDELRLGDNMTLGEFWGNLREWSVKRGIQWMEFSGRDSHEIKNLPNVIAIGRPSLEMPANLRHLDHAVVYSMGRQVWDPNPKKIGVKMVNWYLVPVLESAIKFMTWRFPHLQHKPEEKVHPAGQVPRTLELVREVLVRERQFYEEVNTEFDKKEWDGQEVVHLDDKDIYWKEKKPELKAMTQEEVEILADQFQRSDKRHRSYKG